MDRMEPPQHLRKSILLKVHQEERRKARIFLVGSAATACASLGGIILSINYLVQSLSQSGFYSYLYLLFSDSDIALSYWREWSLSLFETLPLLGITAALAATALLLVSLRVFAINARELKLSFAN